LYFTTSSSECNPLPAYDLEERLPGLWFYAVGHVGGGEDGLPDGWLRYVVPTMQKEAMNTMNEIFKRQ